ncbi:hypothetical protein GALL_406480 [mine drainage metagenome]|uniref:Uncharacterized protein n=1 Tax=mine drainage metagenome TaxID=410659 RepID=A0A1J5QJH1_9ZZZZ
MRVGERPPMVWRAHITLGNVSLGLLNRHRQGQTNIQQRRRARNQRRKPVARFCIRTAHRRLRIRKSRTTGGQEGQNGG